MLQCLKEWGHPVLGSFPNQHGHSTSHIQELDIARTCLDLASHSKISRGNKGLFLSLSQVCFVASNKENESVFSHPIASKFDSALSRESRAFACQSSSFSSSISASSATSAIGIDSYDDVLPNAYKTQLQSFYGISFHVTKDVLIPRQSSEIVVTTALELIHLHQQHLYTVLDLGTGSGCLLLALLHSLPNSVGMGLDLSASALKIGQINSKKLELQSRSSFMVQDFGLLHSNSKHILQSLKCTLASYNKSLKQSSNKDEDHSANSANTHSRKFDLIICNPPYVAASRAEKDLSFASRTHEPSMALIAGDDGLDAYRNIASSLAKCAHVLMENKGLLVLETGAGKAADVRAIFQKTCQGTMGNNRLTFFKSIQDSRKHERCIVFQFFSQKNNYPLNN
jgi:release factor glutamine methyltransferase